MACGWAFWLALLIGTRIPLLWTLSYSFQTLLLPLLYYLLLAYPDGKLRSRWSRALVGAEVISSSGNALFAAFFDPRAFGCSDCQRGLNLLLVRNDFELINLKDQIFGRIGLVVLILIMSTLISRWVRATTPMKRVINPIFIPALVWGSAYLTYLLFLQFQQVGLYDPPVRLYHVLLVIFSSSLVALPLMFLVGFARLRGRRARVSDLVVELGDFPTAGQLERALERALGDPSLEVGIWDSATAHYLTPEGDALVLPDADDDRIATKLERGGAPIGVIVHDPALLDDPGLVAAVTAAARLAVENERLQAEVLEQLSEVHASRARIVEAADAERRRIERNLHDGAQQRLVSLSLALQMAESELQEGKEGAASSLKEASVELKEALTDLRELARGMYPAVLTDQGLPAAVAALAQRTPIPLQVALSSLAERDFPEKAEATAYFVIAESITNVIKYSGASKAQITGTFEDGFLRVVIEDDGVGGADLASGGGLRGLRDRVEALDGQFEVESRVGEGTRITARIPCVS
ncbi:MAG: sensor histidine kinase [Actinomycetota bacterium]|nr:sensor histidine kinase [Actinomycetota bacterium]